MRLLVAIVLMLVTLPGISTTTQRQEHSSADFMIVDCLLPGQIRRIGRNTTYVSARRPKKITALDCRVRNGEYVVEDQASYQTALRVWLEQAKNNDPDAQTMVGEIFEKGMGVKPDYVAAAQWYQRAAEQNFTRAQVNLGHLYEKGLGVTQDVNAALGWYRRAAGLSATIHLETTNDVAPIDASRENELIELRNRTEQLQQETDSLREELERSKLLLNQKDSSIQARERTYSKRTEKVEQITTLKEHNYREKVTALSAIVENQNKEVTDLSNELLTVRQSLEKAASALLESAQQKIDQDEAISNSSAALQTALKQSNERNSKLQAAVSRLQGRESELATNGKEIAELQRRLRHLLTESKKQKNPIVNSAIRDRLVAGPVISLIDPALPKTRGLVKISVPINLTARRIVGRVTAPAGLLALSINQTPIKTNSAGVFDTELRITSAGASVEISAIDQQGKRADIRFELAPGARQVSAPGNRGSEKTRNQVEFGKYYALIIGNSAYNNLPQLKTPINDVQRLNTVLQSKYGFETEVVTNATRYEILSALNAFRAKLTSADNLLVYYAGHGVMDKVNTRGHWLPVDAEVNNTANWISNIAITDILNVIAAKQILLIVDSCYSGTLTRSAIAQQRTKLTDAERLNWLKLMAEKRARVVLTSGGLAPVLDSGGGDHSVFAKSLFDVLESNQDILDGRSLYQGVAARVAYAAANMAFEQTPQYAPISRAGHEAGDFFLFPI